MDVLDIIKEKDGLAAGSNKNIKSLRTFMKLFIEEELGLKTFPLKKVDQDFWKKFQQFSLKKEHSSNYIITRITMINSMINTLDERVPTIKRIDTIYPEDPKETALNRKQVLAIENHDESKHRDLFLFQCMTGMAYDDTQRISKRNVTDTEEGLIIKYIRGKTGVMARIKLSEKALAILERYKYNMTMEYWTYERRLKRMGAELSLPITSHVARHTFGVLMKENGCEDHLLQTMMAHKNGETTKRYSRPSNKALANAPTII